MLQDLCVKVESTEGIVQLVNEIQRDEELISKAIKQKKVKESQQEAERMQARTISTFCLQNLSACNKPMYNDVHTAVTVET